MEAKQVDISDKDYSSFNTRLSLMEKDISDLKEKTNKHDYQIETINEKLGDIFENTKWIKRAITTAVITALCTGVIGGSIAIIFNVFSS
ncbi:hemolysin XhlA family protein [Fictibacillus phosphorivorans]|uniref:hemolysin XhlA family protein n=1 Tax=Fictibacillus phosphorivorans TaxID=1221500 RepID=UPI003CF77ACC